jgi:hypothetical protein
MGGAFPLAANRIVERKLRQLSALNSVPLGPQWRVIACKNAARVRFPLPAQLYSVPSQLRLRTRISKVFS